MRVSSVRGGMFLDTVKRFIRTHRVLAIIFGVDLLLFIPLLSGSGDVILRDFNFPINGESFRNFHFPIFNGLIENSNLPSWYRLPSRIPLILLSFIFSISWVLKLYLFFTFVLGQVCFYVFFRSVVGQRHEVLLGLLSFFYTFNHRFLDFFWETSLVLAYALLPLGLYLISKSIQQRKLLNKYSFFFPIFFLMAFVHPYAITAVFGITIFWGLFVLRDHSFFLRVKHVALLLFVSFCCSLYFIIPAGVMWVMSGPVSPTTSGYYNFRYSVIDFLSSSTLLEKLTLIRSPIKIAEYLPGNALLQGVWFVTGILLFVGLPIYCLYLLRKRKQRVINDTPEAAKNGFSKISIAPMFIIYLLLLVLSFGTLGIQGPLYKILIFVMPADFEWLIRSPLKFALYAMAVLFIALAVASSTLMKHLPKRIFMYGLIAFACIAGTSVFFTYKSYFLDDRLNPVELPREYREINDMLSKKPDNYRVLYLPKYDERETTWSGNRDISPYDLLSSSKSTVSYWWNDHDYEQFLYGSLYRQGGYERVCDYLRPLNIEYLVFHDDRLHERSDFDEAALEILTDLYGDKVIYQQGEWYVFDLNCQDTSFFRMKPNIGTQGATARDLELSREFNVLKDSAAEKYAYPSKDALLESARQSTYNEQRSPFWGTDDANAHLYADLYKHFESSAIYTTVPLGSEHRFLQTHPLDKADKQIAYDRILPEANNYNSHVSPGTKPTQFDIKTTDLAEVFYEIEYKLALPNDENRPDIANLAYDLRGTNVHGLHINYQFFDEGKPLYTKQALYADLSTNNDVSFSGQLKGDTADIYVPDAADSISIYVKGIPKGGQIEVTSLKNSFYKTDLQGKDTIFSLDKLTAPVFVKILRHPNGGKIQYQTSNGPGQLDFFSNELRTEWVKIDPVKTDTLTFNYVDGINYILGFTREQDLNSSKNSNYLTFDTSCAVHEASKHTLTPLKSGISLCALQKADNQKDTDALMAFMANPGKYARVARIHNYYSYGFAGTAMTQSDKFGVTLPLIGKKYIADDRLRQTVYLASAYQVPEGVTHKTFEMPIHKASLAGLGVTGLFVAAYLITVGLIVKKRRS